MSLVKKDFTQIQQMEFAKHALMDVKNVTLPHLLGVWIVLFLNGKFKKVSPKIDPILGTM